MPEMTGYPEEKPIAGLVKQNMQPDPQRQQPPQGQEQPQDPAKQEQYEQLMDNISVMVDGEKGAMEAHEQIMASMDKNRDNPGAALGEALTFVGGAVIREMQKNKIPITDDMLIASSMDTLLMLAELASEAGFFEATEDDIANGYGQALMWFMQTFPDLVDWQGIDAEMQNLDPEAIQAAHTMYNSDPSQAAAAQPQAQAQPQQAPPTGGLINNAAGV